MTAKAWVAAVGCALLLAAPLAAQCSSALVPVSQPVVFPNRAAGPLAWSGVVYGMAKQDADPSTNAVTFATYDANLNQTHADVLVAPVSYDGPRIVLWTGSEFAVFYRSSDFQIVLQRIDVNGNLIAGPMAVAPAHAHAPNDEFDAAWDPARKAYVVLHTLTIGFDRALWLTFLNPDGSLRSDQAINFFFPDQAFPRLAITATGTIGIVWQRLLSGGQQELVFALASPGFVPSNITTIRAGGVNPRLATNGPLFLVVYTQPLSGGGSELRSRSFSVSLSGVVAGADAQLLATGQDNAAFSLIANTTLGEWGLLYVQYPIGSQSPEFGETRLRRILFGGGFVDEPFSPNLNKRTFPPRSELTWNGSAYAASIGRVLSRAEGTESYLVRHCPFRVTINATATVTSPNVPITFTANPQSGAGPYSYTWSFGDISGTELGPTVTHTYRDLGTYTVSVTATDVNGSSTTSSITITIANLRHRSAKHI